MCASSRASDYVYMVNIALLLVCTDINTVIVVLASVSQFNSNQSHLTD